VRYVSVHSGEVCSNVQNNDYGCLWVGPYAGMTGTRWECNLVKASAGSFCIANQAGDSGGPMIRYVNGALKVTGLVSAAGGNKVTCQYNATTCYSTVYYTAMNEIVNTEYPGSYLVSG
jgi:hypothetical protein